MESLAVSRVFNLMLILGLDDLLSNLRMLRVILVNAIVMFRMRFSAQNIDKCLIVSDNDQLEIGLFTTRGKEATTGKSGEGNDVSTTQLQCFSTPPLECECPLSRPFLNNLIQRLCKCSDVLVIEIRGLTREDAGERTRSMRMRR